MLEWNIARHRAREAYWLAQGRPDYAAGAARKAGKKQNAMRAFDMAMNGPFPKCGADLIFYEHMAKAIDSLVAQMTAVLLG